MTSRATNGWILRVSLALVTLAGLACGKESTLPGFGDLVPREPDLRCDVPFTDLAGESFLAASGELPSGIIRTPEEFCRIWDSLTTVHPPCDPGSVDFDREVVLVTSIWSLQSGGVGLAVECVQTGPAGAVEVLVAVQLPGDGCVYPAWIVNPVAIVKIPLLAESATFEVLRTFKIDCD
jgi:hypothetical protein